MILKVGNIYNNNSTGLAVSVYYDPPTDKNYLKFTVNVDNDTLIIDPSSGLVKLGIISIDQISDLSEILVNKADKIHVHTVSSITGLAKVASSGDYLDLNNLPTVYSPGESVTSVVIGAVSNASPGVASSFSRSDHKHNLPAADTATYGAVKISNNTDTPNDTGITVLSQSAAVTKMNDIAIISNQALTAVQTKAEADQTFWIGETEIPINASSGSITALSVDITGNADTATALSNARSITLTGAVSETSVSFDGSKDATFNIGSLVAEKIVGTIPDSCYTNTTYDLATTESDGLLSSADFTKLSTIENGAEVNVIESIVAGTGWTGNLSTSDKELTIDITNVDKATISDSAKIAKLAETVQVNSASIASNHNVLLTNNNTGIQGGSASLAYNNDIVFNPSTKELLISGGSLSASSINTATAEIDVLSTTMISGGSAVFSGVVEASEFKGAINAVISSATEATHAVSADSATHANSATHADSATTADNATHADSATTADNATHATSADNATSAEKVAHSFKVSVNDGTVENTDIYTFDGSDDKLLNIHSNLPIDVTTSTNSVNINHSTSTVTQGTYGDNESGVVGFGATFKVPRYSVDEFGHLSESSEISITLPNNPNTDTKVTQNESISVDGEYPVLLGYDTSSGSITNTVNKTTSLLFNPSTKTLSAAHFYGHLQGRADSAELADMATSASRANTAKVADKVANSLTINAGDAEIAYDGSVSKELVITADSIGAAEVAHTHAYLPLTGGTLSGALNGTDINVTSSLQVGTTEYGFVANAADYSSNRVYFDLKRNSGASWRFINQQGVLWIAGDYSTGSKAAFLAAMKINFSDFATTFVGTLTSEKTITSNSDIVVGIATSSSDKYIHLINSEAQYTLHLISNGNFQFSIKSSTSETSIYVYNKSTNTSNFLTDIDATGKTITATLFKGSLYNNLQIKLNDTTYTYNGGSSISVNITPASIGAAASEHSHDISQITDLETTLSDITSSISTIDNKLNNKIDKVPGLNNTVLTATATGDIIRNKATLSSSKTGALLTTEDVGVADGIAPLNSMGKIDWDYIQDLNMDTVKNVYSVTMDNGTISSDDIAAADIGLQDEIVLAEQSVGEPSFPKGAIFRRVSTTDSTIADYVQLMDGEGSATSAEIVSGTVENKYITPKALVGAANVANGYIRLNGSRQYPKLDGSLITNISASNVVGVLGTDTVPNLDASKITTGTFTISQIPAQTSITNTTTTVPTTAAVYNALSGKSDEEHTHSVATTTTNGFMSSGMVTKLNSIENGAEVNVIESIATGTGWVGSTTVSNKKATVNITSVSSATNATSATTAQIANKTTGSLTIQGNGDELGVFNGSSSETINITPAAIGAAATSHGTHVSYGTSVSALVAGGTGNVGSATTVSRSDHTHTLPAYPTLSTLSGIGTITLNVTNGNVVKSGTTATINITKVAEAISADTVKSLHNSLSITLDKQEDSGIVYDASQSINLDISPESINAKRINTILSGTLTVTNAQQYFKILKGVNGSDVEDGTYSATIRIKTKRSTSAKWEQLVEINLLGNYGITSSPCLSYKHVGSTVRISSLGFAYQTPSDSSISTYSEPSVGIRFGGTGTYNVEIEIVEIKNMTEIASELWDTTTMTARTAVSISGGYTYGYTYFTSSASIGNSTYSTYSIMHRASSAPAVSSTNKAGDLVLFNNSGLIVNATTSNTVACVPGLPSYVQSNVSGTTTRSLIGGFGRVEFTNAIYKNLSKGVVYLKGTLNDINSFVSTGELTNTVTPGGTYMVVGYASSVNSSDGDITIDILPANGDTYTLDAEGYLTTFNGFKISDSTGKYLPLTGGTLTGLVEGPRGEFDTVRIGRLFKNVASKTYSDANYELLIKTGVPKLNGYSMPVLYIHGYTYNSIVDLSVLLYWQGNKFTYKFAKNNGTWNPTLKAFTYTKGGTDYIGLALIGYSYYLRIVVDLFEQWVSVHDYSKGWVIENNTSATSSIVPEDNLTEVPWQILTTDISGSATSLATPKTIALTGGVTGTATAFDGTANIQIPVTAVNPNNLSTVVPITKGGTGASSATNARTALEAGYTIRRTITTTGSGWYRIAATIINVGRNYTDVYIGASLAGRNSQIGLVAAIAQGYSGIDHTAVQLSQKAFVEQYKGGVTKARIVYPDDNYTNKYAYLEIYQEYDASATLAIEFQNCSGWATRYDEPIVGEIPDGYSARELTFVHNAIVADKFVGDVVGTVDFAKNYVGRIDPDSPTAPDFFSTSLNDARTPGWYSVAGIPSNIDGPTEAGTNKVWGLLQVGTSTGDTVPEGSNGWVKQTLTLTTDEVYHRNVVNAGSWKEWLKSVDSNDVSTSLTVPDTDKIPTVGAAKTYIDTQIAEIGGKYLPLTGGTLTGDLVGTNVTADTIDSEIVKTGRYWKNVAKVSSNTYVYEIVIKTRIPKADQASANAIYIYGLCGNTVVNTMFTTYWQNDSVKFSWRNMVQAGSISFEGKIFTYEDDGTEYVGIALLPGTTGVGAQTGIYYPRFQVDFTDLIGSTRDYSKGWTVELNTVKDSASIIPQTNLMDCIKSKLVTDIYGSATSLATPRTIALTGGVTGTATAFDGSKNIQIPVTAVNPNNLSSAVPISKGGTGATTAANARTALEAGYTRRSVIAIPATIGWYRIAASRLSVFANVAKVRLSGNYAGHHPVIGFVAAASYASSNNLEISMQLSQEFYVAHAEGSITKARLVYNQTTHSNNYVYLEVYNSKATSVNLNIEFQDCLNWETLYDELIEGSIPEGYTSKELVFVPNAIVADKFVENNVSLVDKYALKQHTHTDYSELPTEVNTYFSGLTANKYSYAWWCNEYDTGRLLGLNNQSKFVLGTTVVTLGRASGEQTISGLNIEGNASTSDKVNNNLTIKFNSGTTTDTDLFVFDGSTQKTVDITPNAIHAVEDTFDNRSILSEATIPEFTVGEIPWYTNMIINYTKTSNTRMKIELMINTNPTLFFVTLWMDGLQVVKAISDFVV